MSEDYVEGNFLGLPEQGENVDVVKELIKTIINEEYKDSKPIVVATGGFSNLYREENLFDIIVPELVLEGINISVKKNDIQ